MDVDTSVVSFTGLSVPQQVPVQQHPDQAHAHTHAQQPQQPQQPQHQIQQSGGAVQSLDLGLELGGVPVRSPADPSPTPAIPGASAASALIANHCPGVAAAVSPAPEEVLFCVQGTAPSSPPSSHADHPSTRAGLDFSPALSPNTASCTGTTTAAGLLASSVAVDARGFGIVAASVGSGGGSGSSGGGGRSSRDDGRLGGVPQQMNALDAADATNAKAEGTDGAVSDSGIVQRGGCGSTVATSQGSIPTTLPPPPSCSSSAATGTTTTVAPPAGSTSTVIPGADCSEADPASTVLPVAFPLDFHINLPLAWPAVDAWQQPPPAISVPGTSRGSASSSSSSSSSSTTTSYSSSSSTATALSFAASSSLPTNFTASSSGLPSPPPPTTLSDFDYSLDTAASAAAAAAATTTTTGGGTFSPASFQSLFPTATLSSYSPSPASYPLFPQPGFQHQHAQSLGLYVNQSHQPPLPQQSYFPHLSAVAVPQPRFPPTRRPSSGRAGRRKSSAIARLATDAARLLPQSPLHAIPRSSMPPSPARDAAPPRPPKRPAPGSTAREDAAVLSARPPTSAAASSSAQYRMKLPRLHPGHDQEDFSSVVKNRLQSYTRTGQACDRCKVRKIRCDALPEGCSPCANQNLECYVTDRVTGRTERRGYMQELEREKNDMIGHIQELENLLAESGIEVRPSKWSPYRESADVPTDAAEAERSGWTRRSRSLWVKNGWPKQIPRNLSGSTLESSPLNNHLGLVGDMAPLSTVKGSKLSILGMTIDIESLNDADVEVPPPLDGKEPRPLYNKSMQSFLQSTMNINPPVANVELPARDDAFTYAEWYFLMIFPFLPVLHKPTFMKLLTRIYDEPGFEPSVPQLVIVHMVFASIYFQYGVRNWEQPDRRAQLDELSNKHYHFALSKFFVLASTKSVTSVQAMAMIVVHSRSFPKPGVSLYASSFALDRAIELNMHRAIPTEAGEVPNLEDQVRRRVWWTILCVSVTLSGRLGRPMPIARHEFDIGFPDPIPDEQLSEEGVDRSRSSVCTYHVGLAAFRIVPLFMDMYTNIYSARRDPDLYVEVVRSLEERLEAWQEALPEALRMDPAQTEQEGRMYALYAQQFALELRLCLRHPSVAMTTDRTMCAENTRICEETAGQLLKVVRNLLKIKSIDTTWYQTSLYAASIFSTLVAHWERRFNTTPDDIAALREKMKSWMQIMGWTTTLLGCGQNIAREINVITDRTISWIERDQRRRDGNGMPSSREEAQHQSNTRLPILPPLPPLHSDPHFAGASNGTANITSPSVDAGGPKPTFYTEPNNQAYTHLPYSKVGTPHTGGLPGPQSFDNPPVYYSPHMQTQSSASGTAVSSGGPGQHAQLPSQTSNQQNSLAPFAAQASHHAAHPQQYMHTLPEIVWPTPHLGSSTAPTSSVPTPNAPPTTNPWVDWTAAIVESQDRYRAELLPQGTSEASAVPKGFADDEVVGERGHVIAGAGQGPWPLLLFEPGI